MQVKLTIDGKGVLQAILSLTLAAACGLARAVPENPKSVVTATYTARDTLDIAFDPSNDAQRCLDGLAWPVRPFTVAVRETSTPHMLHVNFRSPRPCGIEIVDDVTCEWYSVTSVDAPKTIAVRPAVVVVHESGSDMVVGRMIASQLQRVGVHAFLVQMPGYGQRRSRDYASDAMIELFVQGIADVRRARDAIAAIPQVDSRHIALQGTSLGGFVASISASLDAKFDSVFLLLSGGDLHGVLTTGAKDAEKTLNRLLATGIERDALSDALASVEPLRVVHRLRADETWLYSASFDRVVPKRNSDLLSQKIGLQDDHHIQLLANHYSGIVYLPGIVEKIRSTVSEDLAN